MELLLWCGMNWKNNTLLLNGYDGKCGNGTLFSSNATITVAF